MSSTPQNPAPKDDSRLARLLPGAIVLMGLLELTILVLIGINSSLWWSVLIIVAGWIVGLALVVAAGQQSFVRLRSLVRAVRGSGDVQDHLSRPAFTLLAALLFFFPGVLTDLLAIVLLVTPVQRRTVKAMGLSSGSQSARTVLYRRSAGGVVDGEIIVEAQTPDSSSSGEEPGGRSADSPPTITQD